jgi:hypothetical protein
MRHAKIAAMGSVGRNQEDVEFILFINGLKNIMTFYTTQNI